MHEREGEKEQNEEGNHERDSQSNGMQEWERQRNLDKVIEKLERRDEDGESKSDKAY